MCNTTWIRKEWFSWTIRGMKAHKAKQRSHTHTPTVENALSSTKKKKQQHNEIEKDEKNYHEGKRVQVKSVRVVFDLSFSLHITFKGSCILMNGSVLLKCQSVCVHAWVCMCRHVTALFSRSQSQCTLRKAYYNQLYNVNIRIAWFIQIFERDNETILFINNKYFTPLSILASPL